MAIGYTLDEIPNDITRETPASFEPTLDYVVVKVPRFAFEKFPAADPTLTTTMKSVGEAMAIGRNFTEALQKALRSLEKLGRDASTGTASTPDTEQARAARAGATSRPTAGIVTVQQALRGGASVEEVHEATGIDPWFLDQIALDQRGRRRGRGRRAADPELLRLAKRHGFSRRPDRLAAPGCRRRSSAASGTRSGVRPVYKTVDTCAAEFAATHAVPLLVLRRGDRGRARASGRPVIILGSGPNRIGQGVEFDYSCVHASFALRDAGYDTVMINCNPETVSTDYDTSDRLYFEPLTLEDVLEVDPRRAARRARSPA